MEYLKSLNEPQHAAVVNTEGPTMIIAGAGSGKTRVLTYRIAYLIEEKGVDPFNILSLTFTNKAAREMRERIGEVAGNEARNVWMGTFHSVFARILRTEADKIGYPSNFTIYDADDSKNLVKQIVKEMNLDDKVYKANVVFNRISGAKNRLISWREYLKNPVYRADDESNMKPELGNIYKTYAERCFKAGAMDFDDLLFNTNVLFKNNENARKKYQKRFRYVMVDEFQDTNISQYLITRTLSELHKNICVVGDDAQSIYAFRGADIQNILNFEKDFPDLKIFKLEQNYRSTKTIVNAANSVIQKNKAQLQKNVWTDNDNGSHIEVLKSTTDNEEGKLVASSIFDQKAHYQYLNSDFAILYRTNSQSRAMEEALRRLNIPYKIVGGLSFYQRKEIKDLMAYMRYALNHNDEQSMRRIINYPKRGVGDASVDKVILSANENNASLWDVMQNISSVLPGRAANAVLDFVNLIKQFKLDIQAKDAYEAATAIAKSSGLLKELYEDKTVEGLNRYENVQELLNAVKEFVDDPEREDKSLGSFMQEIALHTGGDNDNDEDQNKVTLMSIHMAKGLEFKSVYIVGLEEDLFPSQMMLSSRADLEEERRLFYVAITRAEEKLFLSYALSRYRFGRLKSCEPSRFIEDIDPSFIKVTQKFRGTVSGSGGERERNSNSNGQTKQFVSSMRTTAQKPTKKSNYRPPADFQPSDTSTLAEGMKVEHPKFGFGQVATIDNSGASRKAQVNFDDFGEKTLLLSFAKLKIHE